MPSDRGGAHSAIITQIYWEVAPVVLPQSSWLSFFPCAYYYYPVLAEWLGIGGVMISSIQSLRYSGQIEIHILVPKLMNLIGSRFCYSIHLGCQRSFSVSTGLDGASCPKRWSYPKLLCVYHCSSSEATFWGLRSLTQTCFVLYILVYGGHPSPRTQITQLNSCRR